MNIHVYIYIRKYKIHVIYTHFISNEEVLLIITQVNLV